MEGDGIDGTPTVGQELDQIGDRSCPQRSGDPENWDIHRQRENSSLELRPTNEVYNRETGYEGGGRRRELWWRKLADHKQMRFILEDILAAARARRHESGRNGEGGGGDKVDY